jgi:hypothetical protein
MPGRDVFIAGRRGSSRAIAPRPQPAEAATPALGRPSGFDPISGLAVAVDLHCNKRLDPYSITSSARTRSAVGIISPSAFAVLRLMTSSTLTACWTGRSAGFSPFNRVLARC